MSMSQSREENIMGLKIYGFDCQNLKNGDNGAMVDYQLIEGCHEQYRGLLFVTPKENNEIPKPFIFCGACDDAGDVDGSTDRVIALDQSSV